MPARETVHGPTPTVGGYVRGFLLALALTIAPFSLVMRHALAGGALISALVGFGLVQLVVHLVCFLHVGRGPEQRWNRIALIFAGVFVIIVVGGSMWIMQHLDHNMMPMPMGD